jgi:deoxyribodipyrimidine photolyase-like uncharacterized protein
MYPEEGLNISKMHRVFLGYMQQNNIVPAATLRQYRESLNAEFNIAYFKPKKDDLCNTCAAYTKASPENKLEMQESYDRRIKKWH